MLDEAFMKRVAKLEAFAGDPYWRMEYFDRKIVEFEEGRKLPVRLHRYRVNVGPWESEFVSESSLTHLPKRINSVDLPPDARIVLLS